MNPEHLKRAQYFIRHIELFGGREIEELAKQFERVATAQKEAVWKEAAQIALNAKIVVSIEEWRGEFDKGYNIACNNLSRGFTELATQARQLAAIRAGEGE